MRETCDTNRDRRAAPATAAGPAAPPPARRDDWGVDESETEAEAIDGGMGEEDEGGYDSRELDARGSALLPVPGRDSVAARPGGSIPSAAVDVESLPVCKSFACAKFAANSYAGGDSDGTSLVLRIKPDALSTELPESRREAFCSL